MSAFIDITGCGNDRMGRYYRVRLFCLAAAMIFSLLLIFDRVPVQKREFAVLFGSMWFAAYLLAGLMKPVERRHD